MCSVLHVMKFLHLYHNYIILYYISNLRCSQIIANKFYNCFQRFSSHFHSSLFPLFLYRLLANLDYLTLFSLLLSLRIYCTVCVGQFDQSHIKFIFLLAFLFSVLFSPFLLCVDLRQYLRNTCICNNTSLEYL